jgi:acyl-CoA synthetase (AMP-forming)/AMP-acid ligase II
VKYNCLLHLENIADTLGTNNKIAIIDNSGYITYSELYLKSRQYGISLLSHGLNPQDRIILSKKDSIEFVIEFLGCLYVGIIPVLIHNSLSPNEIKEIKHFNW